jgi:hypothetical protein
MIRDRDSNYSGSFDWGWKRTPLSPKSRPDWLLIFAATSHVLSSSFTHYG